MFMPAGLVAGNGGTHRATSGLMAQVRRRGGRTRLRSWSMEVVRRRRYRPERRIRKEDKSADYLVQEGIQAVDCGGGGAEAAVGQGESKRFWAEFKVRGRGAVVDVAEWTEYFANLFKVPDMCGWPDSGVPARLQRTVRKHVAAGEQAFIAAGVLSRDISGEGVCTALRNMARGMPCATCASQREWMVCLLSS